MSDLTQRQSDILEFIVDQVRTRGYPPSVREIGEAVGLSSSSSVHAQLSTLQERGMLRRDPDKPRAIELRHGSISAARTRRVPLVGRIAAGAPILADQNVEDTFDLPEDFCGTGDVFMLTVRGDSMVDAGILDGDYVVVRSQPTANNGELVAAVIEGEEATVKRFERRGDRIVLHPANPAYEPMIFTSGVAIAGKVVSVLRRL